jgi:hypothetical protein
MPRTIRKIDVLQQYLCGVMKRASHHAGNVEGIALAVAGAIVWRKNGPIRVLERENKMGNVLWVKIGGRRYAFSYDHTTDAIEVREANVQGKVLKSFSNANPVADVKRFFETL